MRRRLPTLALVATLAALGLDCTAESVFTGDRQFDSCDGQWPVCTFRAGCNLNDREYLEGEFPGSRRFIVETDEPTEIEVTLLFVKEISPGADTEMHWYEPGCFERYSYVSEGSDLFREAGNGGVFSESRTVYEPGDHLVEIFSDAVTEYLLKLDLRPVEE